MKNDYGVMGIFGTGRRGRGFDLNEVEPAKTSEGSDVTINYGNIKATAGMGNDLSGNGSRGYAAQTVEANGIDDWSVGCFRGLRKSCARERIGLRESCRRAKKKRSETKPTRETKTTHQNHSLHRGG